ncbi:MAG: DnaJ domain-containing protein [Agarilytica sp.]
MSDKALGDIIQRAATLLKPNLGPRESKIYDLVDILAKAKLYSWSDSQLVSLYQKLFITQAALCELYFQFEETSDQTLVLTPVSAFLRVEDEKEGVPSAAQQMSGDVVEEMIPNIDFFCNYANFYNASELDVHSMLEGFWKKYTALMSVSPALAALELDDDASWGDIQQRYRHLASAYHPDKGGDPTKFVTIRRAYESLKRSQKSH